MKTAFHKAAAVTTVTLAVALSAGCAKDLGSATPASHTTQPTVEGSARQQSSEPQPTQGSDSPSPSVTDSASTDPSATPSDDPSSASPTPSATPSATPTKAVAILKQGDSGDKVRDLNHRLSQIGWYAGQISPKYDTATVEGIGGFQRKRGLPVTGEVDQTTWDRLVAMTKAPTHDQMYNILRPGPALYKQGDSGDPVRRLQVRLKQLAWYLEPTITGTYGSATADAVKGFQAKRAIPVTGEIDQRTLDLLISMTNTPTTEQMYNKPPKAPSTAAGKLDDRCLTGRAMCIDKTTSKLVWVVDGKPQLTLDVRFGDENNPTREGSFTVGWKAADWVSTIYHTPMPYSMFFSGGEAVHYSSDFAARGYAGHSHGCVNVRDKTSLAWLYGQVNVGDKVIVYRS